MTNRTPDEDFLDGFADRFEQVRWNPGGLGFNASCPVETHEDRRPSLSVDLSDEGSLLVYCFGGCEVEEVMAALALTLRDLFNRPTLRTRRSSPHKPTEQAKWERVAERAEEQQRRELQPWYWQYRAAICGWAGLELEARLCLVHAELLASQEAAR